MTSKEGDPHTHDSSEITEHMRHGVRINMLGDEEVGGEGHEHDDEFHSTSNNVGKHGDYVIFLAWIGMTVLLVWYLFFM